MSADMWGCRRERGDVEHVHECARRQKSTDVGFEPAHSEAGVSQYGSVV